MNHRLAMAMSALCSVAGFSGTAPAQVGVNPVESDAQFNTAMGSFTMPALLNSGSLNINNTAAGDSAMLTTLGTDYAAFGAYALEGLSGSSGYDSTAVGAYSTYTITSGEYNAAVGGFTLESLSTGSNNTAVGNSAMAELTTASENTALGNESLHGNNGPQNNALGSYSLLDNQSGGQNVAVGYYALSSNISGSYNIAIGYEAGANISGSFNVDIGNQGTAEDNGILRIGSEATGQTAVFIAGISSSKITGARVYVTAAGKLGVLASSERYKTAIAPMESNSTKIRQLRPVTFHLRNDPGGTLQYGLIAEEVARVYPELVIHDAAGNVDGVRYDELAPLLLDEIQRQQIEVDQQGQALVEMQRQVAEFKKLNRTMQARFQQLRAKNGGYER